MECRRRRALRSAFVCVRLCASLSLFLSSPTSANTQKDGGRSGAFLTVPFSLLSGKRRRDKPAGGALPCARLRVPVRDFLAAALEVLQWF